MTDLASVVRTPQAVDHADFLSCGRAATAMLEGAEATVHDWHRHSRFEPALALQAAASSHRDVHFTQCDWNGVLLSYEGKSGGGGGRIARYHQMTIAKKCNSVKPNRECLIDARQRCLRHDKLPGPMCLPQTGVRNMAPLKPGPCGTFNLYAVARVWSFHPSSIPEILISKRPSGAIPIQNGGETLCNATQHDTGHRLGMTRSLSRRYVAIAGRLSRSLCIAGAADAPTAAARAHIVEARLAAQRGARIRPLAAKGAAHLLALTHSSQVASMLAAHLIQRLHQTHRRQV